MSLDQATLQALAGFPDALAAHYALFPRSHRNWRPSSWEEIPREHLTPIEQLCHVRDNEIEGYQKRLHYLCSHDQQHLAGLQWLLGQIETADIANRES